MVLEAKDDERVNDDLRAELIGRIRRDWEVRAASPPDFEEWAAVDSDNRSWLARVVDEQGWPLRSEVGEDGARAAWLLAQHADQDPAFQRQCLDLLTSAVQAGEASPHHLAYLTDRVLLAEGLPQDYGTQITARPEGWVPHPLRDPDTVDQRRAAVGLPSLATYLESFLDSFGPPAPTTVPCRECSALLDVWPPEPGAAESVRCPSCGSTATVSGPG
jgi:hypothetical protein